MIVFGFLLNDNHNAKIKIKDQDLIIVELKNAIVTKESEIKLLEQDNNKKQEAILALEERARITSLAAQEAVDRLIELSNIERSTIMPSQGPKIEELQRSAGGEQNNKPKEEQDGVTESSSNSAAGNDNNKSNKVEVINDSSSKKFIELRNNIYSRYK